jgi:hypothetical protein
MKLSEYILKSKEEREAHIDLDSPCEMVSYGRWTKPKLRKELMESLGFVQDVSMVEAKAVLRHMCSCGTSHGKQTGSVCANPLHIALGTALENSLDIPAEIRSEIKKIATQLLTPEQLSERIRRIGRAAIAVRSKAIQITCTKTCEVYLYPSASEAGRALNLNSGLIGQVANGKRDQHKGYTASWFEGPNPFY